MSLNDLRLVLDEDTGSLLQMGHPGVDRLFLETNTDYAGIVDLAFPITEFEPLRLASRFSANVDIAVSDRRVVLTWDGLGASRPFKMSGKVWTQVTLEALPDGQSVLLHCRLRNDSEVAVRQILFPDFIGLLPVAGEASTEFRSGGLTMKPFQVLQPRLDGAWYAPSTNDTAEYTGGSAFTPMFTRWIDLGGLTGGFSMFPRVWAGAPQTRVRLHRTETHKTLRLSAVQDVSVGEGQTWESHEWVLTPHHNGWAKGIEPYRAWVRQHASRKWPMPEHVQRGLGFRTIWMCKGYPADPQRDPDFRFADLPRVARESIKHGLDELVVWLWHRPFTPRIKDAPPYAHLGTPEELTRAVEECHEIGVNVSLFVSWVSISNPAARRYGVAVPPSGWDYHPEMIPRTNPPYATGRAAGVVDFTNDLWQTDVIDSAQQIIERYTPSICWDQVMGDPVSAQLYDLFTRIRETQRRNDPRATFSGESVISIEKDSDYLDYTWNWGGYRDTRAYQAAFDAPRFNLNIDRHIPHVYYAFMDNLYLNVMPSKPDGPNGSAMIGDYPDLSAALKTVNRLRRQFLPYFVNAEPIGDGLLRAAIPTAHTSCYVLEDRVLMLVMNTAEPQALTLQVDLAPWLQPAGGTYKMIQYNMNGERIGEERSIGAAWTGPTESLPTWSIQAFEFLRSRERIVP